MKARHFILTIHDHFAEKIQNAEVQINIARSNASTAPSSPALSIVVLDDATVGGVAFNSALATNQARKITEDQWAMQYITIVHLQPLIEAFDDDATGYFPLS